MDSEQELRTSRVMLQTHAVSMNWEIGQEGQYKQTENIKPVAHNLYLTGDPFFQNYFSCKKKKKNPAIEGISRNPCSIFISM